MKTDAYTKIVLTIIALALTANLIKGSITPAMADSKKYATIPICRWLDQCKCKAHF